MEEQYKEDIRLNYYRFHNRLDYLNDVFNYAENYRFQRHSELSKLVTENTYSEFIEKFGDDTLKEFNNLTLWYKYMLIHSIFISAYSEFESQITSIAEMLEKNVPTRIKIKDVAKSGSDIDKLRKYLDLVHNIQAADSSQNTWIQIDKYRGIRNDLVHHNGRITNQNRQGKIDFLVSYQAVIVNGTFEFFIREIKFLNDFLDLIKAYSWSIVKEIAPVPALPPILPL